jgi:hypothetical protein
MAVNSGMREFSEAQRRRILNHEILQLSVDPSTDERFIRHAASNIFLSPHRDDACFSLGACMSGLRNGTLLNIFTKSRFIARFDWAPDDLVAKLRASEFEAEKRGASRRGAAPPEWIDWVTALRASEDRAFAETLGLRILDLEFSEAPLRGQHPFEGKVVEEDSAQVEAVLTEALARMMPSNGTRAWLMCPAGIGQHVDHLLVRGLILRRFRELRGAFRVGFYEDLHYASQSDERIDDLAQFLDATSGLGLMRVKLPFSHRPRRKLDLVRMYGSQLRLEEDQISRFSPATLLRSGLHEALWVAPADLRPQPR